MKTTTRSTRAVAMACGCLLLAACGQKGEAVATLSATSGRVERSPGGSAWEPAAAGVEFSVGDAMQTGTGSHARLRLTNGGFVNVAENGRLRFLRRAVASKAQAGAGADLAIELGSADIEPALDDMILVTALGRAQIEKGTRVRVRADGQGASLQVLVGRSVLLGPDGNTNLGPGDGIRVKVGSAEIEHFRVAVGVAVVDSVDSVSAPPASDVPQDASSPAARDPERAAEAVAREPDRVDITIAAGESAIVHDAKPPLLVRLRLDGLCAGAAIVDVRGAVRLRQTTGSGSLVLRMRAGTQRYRITCADDPGAKVPRASGALTLLRDSGNVRLSRLAPVNTIETDGRHYTVLFQTRLPVLSVVWPAAPDDASDLSLHISSTGGVKVIATSGRQHQFSSGALPEGIYTCWYATADGKVSPKTRVTIRFDNLAPTAQFFPARSQTVETTAGTIPVDGVTVEGAKVSIDDKPLPVDERGRFRAVLAPLYGDDALAVRIEHPRTGVHYYVRRSDARP
jgi:hypothetical protein